MATLPSIMFGFMPHFLYSQFFITPPAPKTDLTGRTLIVTGSNTGLGKEIATHYVRLNAEKVIIACRSLDKGEAAKSDIEAATGRKGVLDVWQLDLSSYESVKQFAEKAKSLKRIDSLVENAGIQTEDFRLVEGSESTVTVNVISTFLLALLMLPILQQSGRKNNITPTLTIVASEVQAVTPFKERKNPSIFDALNTKEKSDMGSRYPTSKLLEVLICREIARLHPIDQTKVTLNFANPGWCHSDLFRENDSAIIKFFMRLMCRTTEVGSRPLAYAGLAGRETHGKYLTNCRVEPCAPIVEGKEGPELQRRVWGELSEMLDRISPGVTKVLDA